MVSTPTLTLSIGFTVHDSSLSSVSSTQTQTTSKDRTHMHSFKQEQLTSFMNKSSSYKMQTADAAAVCS